MQHHRLASLGKNFHSPAIPNPNMIEEVPRSLNYEIVQMLIREFNKEKI